MLIDPNCNHTSNNKAILSTPVKTELPAIRNVINPGSQNSSLHQMVNVNNKSIMKYEKNMFSGFTYSPDKIQELYNVITEQKPSILLWRKVIRCKYTCQQIKQGFESGVLGLGLLAYDRLLLCYGDV